MTGTVGWLRRIGCPGALAALLIHVGSSLGRGMTEFKRGLKDMADEF